MCPSYICDLIDPICDRRSGLRSIEDGVRLAVKVAKLPTYGDRAFSFYAPRIWNKLPKELRKIESCDVFKSALKTHYYRIAFCGAA